MPPPLSKLATLVVAVVTVLSGVTLAPPAQAAPHALPQAASASTIVTGGTGGTKRFQDVPKSHKFYSAITWMYNTGLTTGNRTPQGITYEPKQSLTRQAMAAFLYRQAGSPKVATPKKPFIDVPTSHKFYSAITWMYNTGLSTGNRAPQGITYEPNAGLTREATAAFLYRQAGSPRFTKKQGFTDVASSAKFFTPIMWMQATGLSTGTRTSASTAVYNRSDTLSREAMAAFLYRQAGNRPVVESGSINVSGSPTVSSRVTAQPQGWQTGLNFSFQWLRDGVKISGANAATYTVQAADVGRRLSVNITGARSGSTSVVMTSPSFTAQTATVTGAKPVVSGNPANGDTLTVSTPGWSAGGTAVTPEIRWYNYKPNYEDPIANQLWNGSDYVSGPSWELKNQEPGEVIYISASVGKVGYTTGPIVIKPMDTDRAAQLIVDGINKYRASNDRQVLVPQPGLTTGAKTWSQTIDQTDIFDHSTTEWRAQYTNNVGATGENIVRGCMSGGSDSPAEFSAFAIKQWLNSPDHLRNIMTASWDATGVGVAFSKNNGYWCSTATQIFENLP